MDTLRCYDFDYSITSFFRDLPRIREVAFKLTTIKHAFAELGIWPVNVQNALKKRVEYSGKRRRAQIRAHEHTNHELDLPPPRRPTTLYEYSTIIIELLDRNAIIQAPSSPTRYTESLIIIKE